MRACETKYVAFVSVLDIGLLYNLNRVFIRNINTHKFTLQQSTETDDEACNIRILGSGIESVAEYKTMALTNGGYYFQAEKNYCITWLNYVPYTNRTE